MKPLQSSSKFHLRKDSFIDFILSKVSSSSSHKIAGSIDNPFLRRTYTSKDTLTSAARLATESGSPTCAAVYAAKEQSMSPSTNS
uniref:Uncharacterized protein n=1 Tax=Ascaris lumbricoides TaxID=6252 RepID=A0A9J2Q5R7_ASCLU